MKLIPTPSIYGFESPSPHTQCGFEGPEKTIEIWFRPEIPRPLSPVSEQDNLPSDDDCDTLHSQASNNTLTHYELTGLRCIKKHHWDSILDVVQAQILSVLSNEYCDAYLLSLFVYPTRIMIKTCGTTTLLHALPAILDIAKKHAHLDQIDAFFYSRKAFLFPDKQVFPHGKFDQEVQFCDDIFTAVAFDTCGYVVGKVNQGADCWNLYVACPIGEHINHPYHPSSESDEEEAESEQTINNEQTVDDDVTLEIMMLGLDAEKMKLFWKSHYDAQGKAANILETTGISNIYPDSLIDDHVFSPCGYSLNGLVGKHYFTIHVTPEAHCSYASFETTVPVSQMNKSSKMDYETFEDVVSKVVAIFGPSSFSTTLFTRNCWDLKKLFPRKVRSGDYRMKERIFHSLGVEWEVLYMQHQL